MKKLTELEFLEYLITPDEQGKVFDIDSYAIEEIQERIKKLKWKKNLN